MAAISEEVLIKVREDGSRVVESSLGKVADASDKAGGAQEALQKILAQVSTVMDRVAASIDRLNVTMTAQTSAAARVAAAEDAAAKATAQLATASAAAAAAQQTKAAAAEAAAAASAAQAESDALATTRIHAMVAASLAEVAATEASVKASTRSATATQAQTAAQAQAAAAAQASAAAQDRLVGAQVQQMMAVEALDDALNGGIKTIQEWRNMEGTLVAAVGAGTISMSEFQRMTTKLDATLPSLTASIDKEARGVASLIGKYDPLSVKAVQLARDELALKKARDLGIISVAQYEKASAGLAAEQIALTAAQEAATVASGTQTAAFKLNARTTRELGTVTTELATGNVGRLKQSMGALANSTGLMAKIFTATGLVVVGFIGILATLAIGFYKGWQQSSALNKALIITGETSGVTAGQVDMLARSMADANQGSGQMFNLFTGLIGTGKVTSDTFATIGAAAKNMMTLTGESVDKVVDSFSNLYDDPIKWADDMDVKFHFLTTAVRDHAQALVEAGDKYAAAEVVAAAFADNTKAKVDQLNESMGTLERLMTRWSRGWNNMKQGLFDIGKPLDDMQKFQKAKDAYVNWTKAIKLGSVDLSANQEVLAHGMRLWNEMRDAQQKAIGSQELAKDKEQADQQRQATLAASKNIDSINDKTQKQITYQTKLNQLTADYKKLYFLDPNNKRLAGVSFDVSGNPSGGSFQSKVDELNREQFGAPKKPKVDHTAERDQKKYAADLQRLQDTIDPTAAAMRRLTDAQDLLTKAVAKGDISQNDADFALSLYQAQLFDTLNPLEALNKKMDEQLTAARDVTSAQTAAAKAQKDQNDLLKAGVVVNDEWLKQQEAKYVAIQKATDQQALLSRIGKSVLKQQQDLVNTLTVLNQLQEKGPSNGGIDRDQAMQYLMRQEADIYEGTSDRLDNQVALYESYYDRINALQKAGYLSEKSADQARLNNKIRIQNLELRQTSDTLGGIAQLMNSHNKKAFAVGKAAAIAQALIQTYSGATAAFASAATIPFVGWVMAPIAAAAAVAAGLANVAAIRSQQMQGFKAGGYTGNYGVNDIVGPVHGREYVMDAATTSRIGVQNLDALRAGAPVQTIAPATGAGGTAGTGAGGKPDVNLKVIALQDKSLIGDYFTDDDNETTIVATLDKLGYKRR